VLAGDRTDIIINDLALDSQIAIAEARKFNGPLSDFSIA
jgi:hypothetical protein